MKSILFCRVVAGLVFGILAAPSWAQTSLDRVSTRINQKASLATAPGAGKNINVPQSASSIPDAEDRVERLEYLEQTGPSGLKKEAVGGTSAPLPQETAPAISSQGGLSVGPMEYLEKMQEEAASEEEVAQEPAESFETNASLVQAPIIAPGEENAVEAWEFWESP